MFTLKFTTGIRPTERNMSIARAAQIYYHKGAYAEKPEQKADQKPVTEKKPETKADQKPEVKPVEQKKPDTKADQKPEVKPVEQKKPDTKVDQKPEVKAEQKPVTEKKWQCYLESLKRLRRQQKQHQALT